MTMKANLIFVRRRRITSVLHDVFNVIGTRNL